MSGLILDGCAGAGGWSEGLRSLGFDSLGIDIFKPACITAQRAGHQRVLADVRSFPLDHLAGRVWGLTFSPPCQAFSKAGRRKGLEDPRGQLVWEPVRWTEVLHPEWVALEQVPEVLPIWQSEARRLKELGYRCWTGIVDSADYGVPQNRNRAILIASLTHQPVGPARTHCEGGREAHESLFGSEPALEPWVTMAEALGWGLGDRPCKTVITARHKQGASSALDSSSWTREWWKEQMISDGWVPKLTTSGTTKGKGERTLYERDIDRPAPTVDCKAGRGEWKLNTKRDHHEDGSTQEVDVNRPAPAVTAKAGTQWELVYPGRSYRSKPLRKPVDQPAPCVALGHNQSAWCWDRPATTVQSTPRVAQPGHHDRQWNDSIRVTVTELGVLQGFPAEYPWHGTQRDQSTAVGNAIPPPLAAAVCKEAMRRG